MSTAVCFVERAASGVALVRLRMFVGRTEKTWTAPLGERAAANLKDSVAAAARWIAEESTAGGSRGDLVLCLDPDGAHCGWVTSPTGEETVVAAAVRAAQAGGADETGTPPLPWLREADLGVDTSAQGLTAAGTALAEAKRLRLAVVATPDLCVRVLLDELDALGRAPARVVGLWHAMAGALAPERASALAGEVAVNEPVAATVLIEPSGRLVWTWSRAGALLCAGSMRLRRSVGVPEAAADGRREGEAPAEVAVLEVSRHEIGRLITEWLAWSAQLGEAPSSLACAGPSSITVGGLGEDLPQVPGIAAVGHALGAGWSGATVQAAVDEDPVGSVLLRLLEDVRDHGALPTSDARGLPVLDPRTTLLELSQRPGRASRTYYRWAAATLAAGAVGVAALGYRMDRSAAAIREQIDLTRAERASLLDTVKDMVRVAADDPDPVRRLMAEKTRLEQFAEKITPERPVLAEFGRVMRALAAVQASMPEPTSSPAPGVPPANQPAPGQALVLKSLTISTTGSGLGSFVVPDAEVGPRLLTELRNQPAVGPRISWTGQNSTTPTERTFGLRGQWVDPSPSRTAGGAPAPAPNPAPTPAPTPADGVEPAKTPGSGPGATGPSVPAPAKPAGGSP
ncbi:MAG: hypothetical protein JNJ48_08715 [Phycisphaerae bacterium]|nr:hypothetical protein [Phycisphaerae bacterium]